MVGVTVSRPPPAAGPAPCLPAAGRRQSTPARMPTGCQQRRLCMVQAHLRRPDGGVNPNASGAAVAVPPPLLHLPPGSSAESIVNSVLADGCALIPAVISPARAAELRELLSGYVPGTAGTGLTTRHRAHALRAGVDFGGDIEEFGAAGRAELLLTLFNRSPAWLELLDPPALVGAVELLLGQDCHLVNQSGWRNHPGHTSGPLHTDELFMPPAPMWLADSGWSPPPLILTALTYLTDVDEPLCPTVVVPGSFRAQRSPAPGETSFGGQTPRTVLATAGDALLFRSDVWHGGGANTTVDRHRHVVETVYGQRKVAQKFFPYLDFQLAAATREAASTQQLRLLGQHPVSNYG